MKYAAVAAVVIAGLWMALGAAGSDPRSGYASVQRIIIAQIIGSERAFITRWNQSKESVDIKSPTSAHIRGWYTTKISTQRLDYQMTVSYDPSTDIYRATCFRLLDEIREGEPPCFR